ncbi:nucleoside-binding protein [Micromonospora matsumotoense]|uniref:Nucleoside-binding protein n=1 Tax=Micromonospora matsumotoense TaxID=121616 RepID=A0A1C4XER0_9ACTN|nr:BMP family ABC transporter substrate-binding protein [Micromonospora matsumotoense]SCF07058.1 nucleoside-binding protein [Micromonospora matsumotoense]
MTMRIGRGPAALLAGALGFALVGCASNDETAPSAAGSASSGTAPAGQPDANGDGKVVIGVLSPGDINDNGYYESFVIGAEKFATEKGWQVIKRGNVPPTEALSAARALCQQGVDMVALGASELKDAIPASEEAVCAKTSWYVPSSENIPQTPRVTLSSDDPNQSMLAAGYATGLVMQQKNATKAGFVTGMEADFSVNAAKAYKAGIRMVVPNATLVTTYTGDFNDSAKAREAVQAQISQGVKVVYPYLGGATDAAAKLANTGGALTLTPGTDRCDSTDPRFDISVIFDPGAYFAAALELFAKGEMTLGTTKKWELGKDPYPAVKICKPTPEQTQKMDAFVADVASGKTDTAATVARLGS